MLSITAGLLEAQLCCSGHLAHMMRNMNALSHFLMPIKCMVNGWQVGHWSLVRTRLRQILNRVVPAPQSGKLQLKTICYSKDCAALPWETLNRPGTTAWLCTVLLFYRTASIMFKKKHLWHLRLLTCCDNLTDFSSTKPQNRKFLVIKRKIYSLYIFYKDFPILSRLNYHPLCLNKALSSNQFASLSGFQLSSFYSSSTLNTNWKSCGFENSWKHKYRLKTVS